MTTKNPEALTADEVREADIITGITRDGAEHMIVGAELIGLALSLEIVAKLRVLEVHVSSRDDIPALRRTVAEVKLMNARWTHQISGEQHGEDE